MTSTTTDDIPAAKLARIRALIALSEDEGAEDGERDLAAQRAAELMAKYAVDLAMVSASRPADDPVEHRIITVTDPYVSAKATLLQAIAIPMSCKIIQGHGGQLHLFGHRSDIEHVNFLFTHLLLQAVRGVTLARPTAGRAARSAAGVAGFRRAWLMGFARVIGERMAAGRTEAVREHAAAGTGSAVVLVARADDAQVLARQTFPKTRTRSATTSSLGGYTSGMTAGGRADIGQGRVSGGRRAIGG